MTRAPRSWSRRTGPPNAPASWPNDPTCRASSPADPRTPMRRGSPEPPKQPVAGRRAPAARGQLHERHHRAAEGGDVPPPGRLPAGLAMAYHAGLGPGGRYLWTLPMFHCNGWCFTWAVTAAGGTHVCLRIVNRRDLGLLSAQVTHFSAAPTVLTMLAEDPAAAPLDPADHVATGGAPPSPPCSRGWRSSTSASPTCTGSRRPSARSPYECSRRERAPPGEQAMLRARQGAPNIINRPLRVVDEGSRTSRPTARRWARSPSAATTSCSATTATTRPPGRPPGAAGS